MVNIENRGQKKQFAMTTIMHASKLQAGVKLAIAISLAAAAAWSAQRSLTVPSPPKLDPLAEARRNPFDDSIAVALASPYRGRNIPVDKAGLARFEAQALQPQGGLTALPARGDPVKGTFSPVAEWPFVGLHAVLTPDGRVLSYGYDEVGPDGYFKYDLWTPQLGLGGNAHQLLPNTTKVALFCNSQLLLPNGSIELWGGSLFDPVQGKNVGGSNNSIVRFNAVDGSMTKVGDMQRTRWYATTTMLPSGEVYIQGGSGTGSSNPELRSTSANYRLLGTAPTDNISWWYPRNFVGPDGLIFGMSSGYVYHVDPRGSGEITPLGRLSTTNTDASSTAVMFRPGKILQVGGGTDGLSSARNTGSLDASLIDINGTTPVVTALPSPAYQRHWGSSTVLPDGRVFVSGGSPSNNNPINGVSYTSELYDPTANRWTLGATAQRMRLYHSTSLLLPDATVLTMGGATGTLRNQDAEVYYPPYLFNADGTPAARPIITGAGMDFLPGQKIRIAVGDPAGIRRVTLIKTGSVTHSFDMDQRFLDLPFTRDPDNALQASLPANAYETPPGFYLLFVINERGVPSEAAILRIQPIRDLVVNGDFENNPVANGGSANVALPGWGSNYAITTSRNAGYTAASNASLVQLDATATGGTWLYQSIATTAGTQYELSFLHSPRPGVSAGSNKFLVYWNNALVATIGRDGVGLSDSSWKAERIQVTGTGWDTIKFFESDGDAVGALIDDVRLVQAIVRPPPPPASILVNGDFETNPVANGGHANVPDLAGWSGSRGMEVWRNYLVTPGLNASNVTLDSGNGTWTTQYVATAVNVAYELSFLHSPRPGVSAASNTFDVYWGSTKLATIARDGSGLSNASWTRATFTVVGTGWDGLQFFEGDADAIGALIDDVRLVPIARPPPPPASLLVNGDFETNAVANGSHANVSGLAGWSGNRGTEVWRNYLVTPGLNASNITLDGGNGTWTTQSVATVANATYELSFLHSPRPGVSTASNAFDVYWGNTRLATIARDGSGLSNASWTRATFTVVGTGWDALQFFEGDADAAGALIDDVRLVRR
jgi:hypothetical protein